MLADEPRFNTSTFSGRWARMIQLTDPRTLVASKDEVFAAVGQPSLSTIQNTALAPNRAHDPEPHNAALLKSLEQNPDLIATMDKRKLWDARALKA